MLTSATLLKLGAAIVGLVLVSGGALGALAAGGTFSQPTVEELSNQWGEIGSDVAEVETTVVVDNPNSIGVPGVLSVDVSVELNGIEVARGSERGIGLTPGENTVRMTSQFESGKMSEWWVSHINNGERTTMEVQGAVTVLGYSEEFPAQTTTVETDILAPMNDEEPETVTAGGEEFLIVENRRAEWGEATAETTPLTFSADVTNVHDYDVRFDRIGYVVRMNDVPVGEGTVDGVRVGAGERETLTVEAGLDSDRMGDWWTSHLRNDERTVVTVSLFGIVEDDGERREFALLDQQLELRTDLLGGGGATVNRVESDDGAGLGRPTVESGDQRWGEITDETSTIETDVVVDTGDAEFSGIDLAVGSETAINGVSVTDDEPVRTSLSPGENRVRVSTTLENDRVPEWWARHLNNGERSTVETTATGTVDAGFTRFDVPAQTRTQEFETDLVGDLNGERDERIVADGHEVLRVTETRAEWGEATAEEAPLDVSATVENEQRWPVTVRDIEYRVTLNDVVLADGVDERAQTVHPGQTETIDVRMPLDNARMDEWWVSHLRDDERSALSMEVYATVEVGDRSERVRLDFLETDETIETDVLGSNESNESTEDAN